MKTKGCRFLTPLCASRLSGLPGHLRAACGGSNFDVRRLNVGTVTTGKPRVRHRRARYETRLFNAVYQHLHIQRVGSVLLFGRYRGRASLLKILRATLFLNRNPVPLNWWGMYPSLLLFHGSTHGINRPYVRTK